MTRFSLCLIIILVFCLTGACNPQPAVHAPPASPSQPPQDVGTVEVNLSATPEATPTVTLPVPTHTAVDSSTPEPATANLAMSFPLAPDTSLEPDSDSEQAGDTHGSFRLQTKAPVIEAAQFYETRLSQEGWTLHYIDPNFQGGVTQHWISDNLHLSMDFIYDETGPVIQCQWKRIDPLALERLPANFPLPEGAQLVSASETSWEFYITQDRLAVASFFEQELSALGWDGGSAPFGSMGDGCGGDCGGWEIDFPPGVTPVPTPTLDPRPTQVLVYSLPNGDEINLEIRPHQEATILYITLTLKNVGSAGLPQDVPLYPGYTLLSAAPGMVSVSAPADLETMVRFYVDGLTAAGWAASQDMAMNTPGLYIQGWEKGTESIQIQIFPMEGSSPSSIVNLTFDSPEP